MRFLEKISISKRSPTISSSKTSPLSSSANKILVDCLELVKLINLLLNDNLLKSLAKTFQQGLVQYVVTNPEMTHFKEIKSSLEFGQLSKSFVETQIDRLEDGLRAYKIQDAITKLKFCLNAKHICHIVYFGDACLKQIFSGGELCLLRVHAEFFSCKLGQTSTFVVLINDSHNRAVSGKNILSKDKLF